MGRIAPGAPSACASSQGRKDDEPREHQSALHENHRSARSASPKPLRAPSPCAVKLDRIRIVRDRNPLVESI
jgi:hypothetical protein